MKPAVLSCNLLYFNITREEVCTSVSWWPVRSSVSQTRRFDYLRTWRWCGDYTILYIINNIYARRSGQHSGRVRSLYACAAVRRGDGSDDARRSLSGHTKRNRHPLTLHPIITLKTPPNSNPYNPMATIASAGGCTQVLSDSLYTTPHSVAAERTLPSGAMYIYSNESGHNRNARDICKNARNYSLLRTFACTCRILTITCSDLAFIEFNGIS